MQFLPPLPPAHQAAIGKMGNGVANKIIVSFARPFWDESKLWVNLVSKEQNRYPVALSMGGHTLCFFVSGEASKRLSELSDAQIQQDLLAFLKGFRCKEEVEITAILVTRWHKDPHSLGSYSYLPVGATAADIRTLRTPISERLWLIGEHCHPGMNGCAHAAFETGVWAGAEAGESLSPQK